MTEQFKDRKQEDEGSIDCISIDTMTFPLVLNPKLIATVRSQYRLDFWGIHGLSHWSRVLFNGLRLARYTGADENVVALFALFHDACRINDCLDPQHGARGADLARQYRGQLFELSDKGMMLLYVACENHTLGFVLADPTVQTCWDADRLDLWRIGVRPDRKRLCTDAAKQIEFIKESCQTAQQRDFPYRYHWLQEDENSML